MNQPPESAAQSRSSTGRAEKRRVALISVGAAIFLTLLKLVFGLLTGSLGLLAEAAHSGLDLVAAIITYFAVHLSDKPADAEHRYGHGKVENLSALVETLLLLLTCAWIVYEVVERLFFHPVEIEPTWWAFGVIIVSILIDLQRTRVLQRVAREHNSQALEADALHFQTDIWSSSVVLVGLMLVRLSQSHAEWKWLASADALAALVVAGFTVFVSMRLGRRSIDVLMDRVPTSLAREMEERIRRVTGVLDCRQLRVRQAGQQTFVDVVIDVDRNQTLESSHAISVAVEEAIRRDWPGADVLVHFDPVNRSDETLLQRLHSLAGNQGHAVHNVLVSERGRELYLEWHVEMDEQLTLREAHRRADQLEAAVQQELPTITAIMTHIEPPRHDRRPLENITAAAGPLIDRVRRIVRQTTEILEAHDITVHQAGDQLYLAMHCTFDPQLSVRHVHDLCSTLEDRLRHEIPALARITTHPEPAEDRNVH
ncbi:MAG: Ferrous-iron efflux pump FieF [Phycisphaerae bacterium]|nr:Ferrous-iron efflux pump FieF [Phycisphaerae bacterium]